MDARDQAAVDAVERANALREHDQASGIGRIFGFSDGVFAIAITLLVLDLRVPDILGVFDPQVLNQDIEQLWPVFVSFVISFVVIGLYWTIHHRIFRAIWHFDSGLIWLNLAFLFGIALLPFPTSLLGRLGDVSDLVMILYAGNCALVGILAAALAFWAEWRGLVTAPNLKRVRRGVGLNLIAPAIFLGSLLLIPFVPTGSAMYVWLLIPVALQIGGRLLDIGADSG